MAAKICRRSSVDELIDETDSVIVVDALRASVTTTALLECGASFVRPVRERDPETVDKDIIMVGEENGEPLPGFDFGNSPTEIKTEADRISDRGVVHQTTNGTDCIKDVTHASEVFTGSVVNQSALTTVVRDAPGTIWVVPARRHDEYAREDMFAALRLVESITEDQGGAPELVSQYLGDSPTEVFTRSDTGRHLASLGYHDDLELCARTDVFDVVPRLVDGQFVADSG